MRASQQKRAARSQKRARENCALAKAGNGSLRFVLFSALFVCAKVQTQKSLSLPHLNVSAKEKKKKKKKLMNSLEGRESSIIVVGGTHATRPLECDRESTL